MKYKEWLTEALWNTNVYRYTLFLSDVAWKDIHQLSQNKLLVSSCDQLLRSAGSVSANISEGYSRRSKRDQARFYEYALGSARECRGWYFKIRHNLGRKNVTSRFKLITEIIKILLHITPTQRGQRIKENT